MRPTVALTTTTAVLATTQAAALPTSQAKPSSLSTGESNTDSQEDAWAVPITNTAANQAQHKEMDKHDTVDAGRGEKLVIRKRKAEPQSDYDDIGISGCANECSDNGADNGCVIM